MSGVSTPVCDRPVYRLSQPSAGGNDPPEGNFHTPNIFVPQWNECRPVFVCSFGRCLAGRWLI